MSAPVLLFDLDGTLTDPRLGLVRSIRQALERLDGEVPSAATLASYIGPPLRRTFATLLKTSEVTVIERAMTLFRARYADVGLFENAVYAGVPEMLEALSATARLFVATGKPALYAERVVRHFGLDCYFAGVYGPELDGRFDDKAELLAHLLGKERLTSSAAVMIGDRANDVVAARANGLRVVGALWGYGSKGELVDAGADSLCEAPAGLAACLRALER